MRRVVVLLDAPFVPVVVPLDEPFVSSRAGLPNAIASRSIAEGEVTGRGGQDRV